MALSYRTRNSLSAPMSMKQSCISSVYTIYSRNNAPRALSLDQSATRHYSEPDLSTERPRAHRAAALHTASRGPRSTVACSASIVAVLGSTVVQQSACREPTERVSRAPGRLSVSAGIARMGRDTQNR